MPAMLTSVRHCNGATRDRKTRLRVLADGSLRCKRRLMNADVTKTPGDP